MEVTGVLHVKYDTQEVSGSFRKRDFVLMVADNPQYPQYISFQLNQEKCALLDLIPPSATITVSFNLRGRQWTNPQGETKYFNTLEVWKVQKEGSGGSVPQNETTPQIAVPTQDLAVLTEGGESDDLPF